MCHCFVLLPWPSCWSWMTTLATFLKGYSNLRTVKYFLHLVDLFLSTLPEKKLPVNEFRALQSAFDWEGLAQSAFPNYLKQSALSSVFETKMLLSFPVLFSTVQPIWIHLSARCSSFPSVKSFCSWP